MMQKIPLIVVCGPTASGKTSLAVEIAKLHNCEVVSADSMQIYKHMQIATAKPTAEEMQGVAHHLIDFLEPDERFSVADYVRLAKNRIEDIYSRGKLPLLCGGTGLYISSLIDNVAFDDTCSSTELRNELLSIAQEKGGEYLLDMLAEFDPESAQRLHPNNLTRIIRAIEVYKISGTTMTQAIKNSRRDGIYELCMIGISYFDREKLYQRINVRVDMMVESGLIDEAREVLQNDSLGTSFQAIGYKELKPYFNGEKTAQECIEKLKLETRHYAKRQLTWFRRDDRINWIYPDKLPEGSTVLSEAEKIIEASNIIDARHGV